MRHPSPPSPPSPHSNRKGYVLLMVLMLLVVASFLSVGTARKSIALSRSAALGDQELQTRWGRISVRTAVLNRAEILLRSRELRVGGQVASMETTIRLGGEQIHLLLSDEQAKLNVNLIARQHSLPAVRRSVSRLTEGEFFTNLRPNPSASGERTYPPAFDGWGSVYDLSDILPVHPDDLRFPNRLGKQLTCWGSGSLRLNRASPAVFREFCELTVSPETAITLATLRGRNPDWNLEQLLQGAALSAGERRILRRYLTDRSRTHSLWTTVVREQEGDRKKRSWPRLDIVSPEDPTGNTLLVYEF